MDGDGWIFGEFMILITPPPLITIGRRRLNIILFLCSLLHVFWLQAPIDFLLRGVMADGEEVGLELMEDYVTRVVTVKSFRCSNLDLAFAMICTFAVSILWVWPRQ